MPMARAVPTPPAAVRALLAAAAAAESAGDDAACGLHLVRAQRAQPPVLEAVQLALNCAARLSVAGREPPAGECRHAAGASVPRASPTLSVVTCSIDPLKYARLEAHLHAAFAGRPWELIGIHDARSLGEGWRRGVAASRGELLVLCHDDIELLGADPYGVLVDALAVFDLVGCAGTRRLSSYTWVWGGLADNDGRVAHPAAGGGFVQCVYGPGAARVGGIEALDGALLGLRRAVFERVDFDIETYDGFHLYDIDFSHRAARAGLAVGLAADLVLLHHSDGRFDAEYKRYAERFLRQHPHLPSREPAVAYAHARLPDRAAIVRAHAWLDHWHAHAH